MKKFIYCILFLYVVIGIKQSYGQAHEKISIPILKESSKIDSLIDLILDPGTAPQFNSRGKPFKGRWIDIYFGAIHYKLVGFERREQLGFNLRTSSNFVINYYINDYVKRQVNFGYFKYRRYNILVHFESALPDFFRITEDTISFKYVYALGPNEPLPIRLLVMPPGTRVWVYDYTDGHFEPAKPLTLR